MAVKLRLMRMGKKKQPSYRVVAADARSPRDGRFIEIVGTYDPRAEPSTIRIDNDKATGWLHKGAQPTESVRRLLKISGAWDEFEAAKAAAKAASPAKASASKKTTASKSSASKASAGTAKATKATKATKSTAKATKAGGASKTTSEATAKKAAAKKATNGTTKAAESSAATDEDAS